MVLAVQGLAELQASAGVPEVAAEMDLAGAHAYRWMHCWQQVRVPLRQYSR